MPLPVKYMKYAFLSWVMIFCVSLYLIPNADYITALGIFNFSTLNRFIHVHSRTIVRDGTYHSRTISYPSHTRCPVSCFPQRIASNGEE